MSKTPKGGWQYFERLPRPALRWVCLIGATWPLGGVDLVGVEMDGTTRGVLLGFVALVYGLRGWEKLKEPPPVAQEPVWRGDPYGVNWDRQSFEGGLR